MSKDPNPMATGPTKWRAEHCVTHHYGCDCREWEHATRVAALESDAERWREFCRQAEAGEFPAAILYDARMMGAGVLEMHMDGAMREQGANT